MSCGEQNVHIVLLNLKVGGGFRFHSERIPTGFASLHIGYYDSDGYGIGGNKYGTEWLVAALSNFPYDIQHG